jgi:hypothetical protein
MTAVNANPVLRPATRRTPWVGYVRDAGLSLRPSFSVPPMIVARVVPPPQLPRAKVLPVPPPPQTAFNFKFQALAARLVPAPPLQRPRVLAPGTAAAPAPTLRPPTATVVRPLPGAGTTARSRYLPSTGAHQPPAYLVRPVVSRLTAYPRPAPWPPAQYRWMVQTHVPVFPYGPRFTIRDPRLSATLALQGATFSIHDPGLVAAVSRQ